MTFLEFRGTARLDRRTKRLVKRLGPDDIAIIDHAELDRVSAEELVESGVRVVVNVAPSLSGRYPNPGPLELVRGGVCLIDAPGAPLFEHVREGEELAVRGAAVFRDGSRVAAGHELSRDELEQTLAEQQGRVTEALEAFADNTMRYLREEGRLLTEGIQLPQLQTRFRDRHALVVARGPGYKKDLADRPPLHPRVQARARRGRRRRGRAPRGGLPAGRDRRRHGLRLRRRAAVGRGARRPRIRRWSGSGPRNGSTGSASRRWRWRRRESAKTSPCCSRTRRVPS